MTEVMRGVLMMPPSLWKNDPIEIAQRYGIYKAAAKEIDRLQAALDEVQEARRRAEEIAAGFEVENGKMKQAIMKVTNALRDLFRPIDRGTALDALTASIWEASYAAQETMLREREPE